MREDDLIALSDMLRDVVRDEVGSSSIPSYLSTKMAAKIAGVSPATIRSWVKRGELREYWAGNDLRVRLVDIEAYLARKNPENAVDLEAQIREMMS
jgi:excisionase family DNA binding protein